VLHPKCIDGENACPPEDVGGPHGCDRLRFVLGNPSLDQYADPRSWRGLQFDPGRFSVEYQNMAMWDVRETKLPWWAR
jgi:hypothetical protein